jgi:hypothetical protein
MPIATIFMVAVIALIIVGGIIFGKSLLGGGNLTNTEQEVSQIVSGVQSLYANQVGFSGLTDAVAIQANIPPSNEVNAANGTISNPYGGSITLQPDATYANAFDVIVGGLGNGACAKLATGLTAYALEINGTAAASNGQPVPPATATSDCNAGAGANSITLVETQANG